jgi:DNA-binding transcriptional MocR family regulator
MLPIAAEARQREPEPVSAFDRGVSQAITAYAFDEAECCPSQRLVALDVSCARETVNRSVGRLVRAGWLAIRKRRRAGWPWDHNVYELLEPYAVSALTARKIIRRAHKRARRALRRQSQRPLPGRDHTNDVVVGQVGRSAFRTCRCRHCQVDKATVRPPPRLERIVKLTIQEQVRRMNEDAIKARCEAGPVTGHQAIVDARLIADMRLFV